MVQTRENKKRLNNQQTKSPKAGQKLSFIPKETSVPKREEEKLLKDDSCS